MIDRDKVWAQFAESLRVCEDTTALYTLMRDTGGLDARGGLSDAIVEAKSHCEDLVAFRTVLFGAYDEADRLRRELEAARQETNALRLSLSSPQGGPGPHDTALIPSPAFLQVDGGHAQRVAA